MNFTRFFAILHARNLEFVRDRSSLGWNLLLPIFLVAGFAFFISSDDNVNFKVSIHGAPHATSSPAFLNLHPFFKTSFVTFIDAPKLDVALQRLSHHQTDMVISLEGKSSYWINLEAKRGYLAERLLWGAESSKDLSPTFVKQTVSGKVIRYVDWAMPGIMAMNMMFSCLFGIGYVIVRYRKTGVLKRFRATPLTAFEFVLAQIMSRLLIIIVVTVLVFFGCDLFVGFVMRGSYLSLLIVFITGSFSLIALSLVIAARTSSEEFANGMLNLLSWPMLILSGVWFSLDSLHPVAKQIANLLPLTHMIAAARAIMLEGAGLAQVTQSLVILLVMGLVFVLFAAYRFKWERY